MKTLALFPLCLPLAACVTPASPLPEGPARLGQTVYVDGPTVRPIAVIEDSRCPTDVVCVWAGRVVIRAEVGTGPGKREMTLTLGEPVPVADGALILAEVAPVARHTQPVKPADYRFTFKFAGGL
ncbi:hypothetical protein [Sphingomonas sp. G-3-2-10]|uniref:hypothetical protein n=1 Tax=Sphingomonas sp. G-3-2-10 TaxID=2728838 RepID=UPI00146BE3B0|nr:hypothetical protein [Sphingomonas sp. G-3-2-10]NML05045.1 hypothetical protein [Sphingomonas sp. G-3-2-10]